MSDWQQESGATATDIDRYITGGDDEYITGGDDEESIIEDQKETIYQLRQALDAITATLHQIAQFGRPTRGATTMAIYTMYIKRAHDPLSGEALDMWAVMESETHQQIAYCSSEEDAERIKALLVYYGDRFPPQKAKQ